MKHGLKGVTDATVFCKSMQKGGPAPMIRSMKSYEVGGATGEMQCTEYMDRGKKKKRCKQTHRSKGKSQETKGGVAGVLGGLLAGAGAAMWMKNQKKQ
jgi:hypothetical protein